MVDIILESIRAVFILLIFGFLLIKLRSEELKEIKDSFIYILAGFGFLCFGSFVDITDNFESLNQFVIIGDTEYQAVLEKIVGYLLGYFLLAVGIFLWIPKLIEHQKHTRAKLAHAEGEVKTLSGLLPICASCKKIRDDKGNWKQMESYIHKHSEAQFSHGLCPDCFKVEMENLDAMNSPPKDDSTNPT
jgi:hypothetical protein